MREGREAVTLRAGGRGRAVQGGGRERNNSPFPAFFDPRVGRDSRANLCEKIFLRDGALWGKFAKTPIK